MGFQSASEETLEAGPADRTTKDDPEQDHSHALSVSDENIQLPLADDAARETDRDAAQGHGLANAFVLPLVRNGEATRLREARERTMTSVLAAGETPLAPSPSPPLSVPFSVWGKQPRRVNAELAAHVLTLLEHIEPPSVRRRAEGPPAMADDDPSMPRDAHAERRWLGRGG